MKKQTLFISKNHQFVLPLGSGGCKELKRINLKQSLNSFLKSINYHLPQSFSNDKSSVAQKVLDIFSSKEILSGTRTNITKAKSQLLNQLDYFIEKDLPIEFTLLAVPFKTGNPLKVKHAYPDLGEIIFLLRIYEIAKQIEQIYKAGAKFIILSEGKCLADIMGVAKSEAIKYRDGHKKIIKQLELEKYISILDLDDDVVAKVKDFAQKQLQNESYFRKEYENNNAQIMEEVNKTLPTIQASLNKRNLTDKQACLGYLKPTEDFKKKALKKTFAYLAFHKTRYDTQALEKVFPKSIRCTLTPRLGRLGIIPVNGDNLLFPHHGVGVILRNRKVTVMYDYDVRRLGNFREVYLKNRLLCFEEI